MSELNEKLYWLLVQKLEAELGLNTEQLISELESEIEADPQFAGLLRTNHLMIQFNQGDAQAFQTIVEGGIAYIGGTHYHLEREKLEEILTQLIPKILETNARSTFLDHQPPDIRGFQGRQEEINQLQQWLSNERIRLMGIVSPGGYGKSTLAAYLYEKLSTLEQRIWITFNKPCSFRNFSFGLLEELGQKIDKHCDDESLQNALIKHLSNHSFLLVLDNLESLLDRDRRFIDLGYETFLIDWLKKKNTSSILCTSREQPTILGEPENEYEWLSLRGLTDNSGIQLLRDQNITGTQLNLQRFIQATDGSPLLLKLAAIWLRDQPTDTADVEHILSQRDLDRFTQLVGIHRKDPEASIGRLLTASMERLAPRLKELWLNLSVYKYCSVNLAAAEAVAAEPITTVQDDLRELAKRSLLEEQKNQGQWQYRFLKLVKDFAQQQAGNQVEVKQKAIEYCRSVAMPSGWTENEVFSAVYYDSISEPPNWKNQGDVAEYLEIFYHYYELGEFASAFYFFWSTGCDLFLELRGYNSLRLELYKTLKDGWAANLSSLESYLDHLSTNQRKDFNSQQTLFAEMLDCLGTAYRSLGQYPLAIDSHNQALARFCKIADRDREQAKSLRNLGKVYSDQGVYKKALDCLEQARAISHRINDVPGESLSLQILIDTDNIRGEHQKNVERYKELIALCQQLGDRLVEAKILNDLGSTYKKIGKYREAVCIHRKALKNFQKLASRQGEADSLSGLGDAYKALGKYEEAFKAHQQALLISDDRLKQAYTLCQLGWDLQSSGQSEKAIAHFEQAREFFRTTGNRAGVANALNGLGAANSNPGDYQQAESYYQQALNIYRELHNLYGEAAVLNNLGWVYESQGLEQYQQAIDSYHRSLEISSGLPDHDLGNDTKTRCNLGRVCNLLGQDYYNQRQYYQATQFYQQALTAFEGIKGAFRTETIQKGKATALLGLGNAYHFLGQYSDAVGLHQRTLEISRKIKDDPGEAGALLGLGDVYYSLGNYNKPPDKNALNFYQEALIIFQKLKDKRGKANVKLGLGRTYHALGQCQRAIEYLKETLELLDASPDRGGEADGLDALGRVYQSQGRYDDAIDNYEQALNVRCKIGDRAGEATSRNNLGDVYHALGNYTRAREYHTKACSIFSESEVGAIAGLANAYNSLGVDFCSLKHYQEASLLIQEALKSRGEIGDSAGMGDSLCNFGNLHYSQGIYGAAAEHYKKARDILKAIGHREFEAKALNGLATVYYVQMEYRLAIESYKQAWGIFEQVGHLNKARQARHNQSNACYALANQQYSEQQYQNAIELYEQAWKVFNEVGYPDKARQARLNQSNACYVLGQQYYEQKVYQSAIEPYTQASRIICEIGDRIGEAQALHSLGNTFYALAQYRDAIEPYSQASDIRHKIDDRAGESQSLHSLGNVFYVLKQYQDAIDPYNQASKIRREIGNVVGEVDSLFSLGNTYYFLEQYQNAINLYREVLDISNELSNYADVARTQRKLGDAYKALGRVYCSQRDYQKTIRTYRRALRSFCNIHDRFCITDDFIKKSQTQRELGDVYNAWGQHYYEQREYGKATKIYQRSLGFFHIIDSRFRMSGDHIKEAQIQLNLGNAQYFLREYPNAIKLYKQAWVIFRNHNSHEEVYALLALSNVYQKSGKVLKELLFSYQAIGVIQRHNLQVGTLSTLNWKYQFLRLVFRGKEYTVRFARWLGQSISKFSVWFGQLTLRSITATSKVALTLVQSFLQYLYTNREEIVTFTFHVIKLILYIIGGIFSILIAVVWGVGWAIGWVIWQLFQHLN